MLIVAVSTAMVVFFGYRFTRRVLSGKGVGVGLGWVALGWVGLDWGVGVLGWDTALNRISRAGSSLLQPAI